MTNQWASYFASSTSNDVERWINESADIDGVKVYAFSLLSSFGRGNSFLQFVSKELIRRCLNSLKSKRILSNIKNTPVGGNSKHLDDQIISILKTSFKKVNRDYHREYAKQMSGMNPRNNYSSDESDDNFSLSPPTTNGCSAILALIVNDRLFVANIGNSTAILCKQLSSDRTDENYLFQLSALHEDSEKTTDINSLPNRCFGGPASKNEAYCEPFVVSQGIQLEHTIQFLLFASPLAVKIVTQLNLESLDNVNAYLVSLLIGDLHKLNSIEMALSEVVNQLTETYSQISSFKPNIALAYIDLRNDNAADKVETQQHGPESVLSEVDWSEFETHEARDIFTAMVNSLKQNQFDLGSISEH